MISYQDDPKVSLSQLWSQLLGVSIYPSYLNSSALCAVRHTNLRTFVHRGPDEIATLVQAAGQDVTSEGPRRAEHRPTDGGCESIVFFHTDTLAKSPHLHGRSQVFARTYTGTHIVHTHSRSAPPPSPPPPPLCPLPPPVTAAAAAVACSSK